MSNPTPPLFPNNPQKDQPLEQSLKVLFNDLKDDPGHVQRLIQEMESGVWIADHPIFNLLEVIVELPGISDSQDNLWGEIMDYLIHDRQNTLDGDLAFKWLLKIVQNKRGEGKAIPLWDNFFKTFSREQKVRLLSVCLSADYRVLFSKLLPTMEDPKMTDFKAEENPYALVKTLALVNDLNEHGFSLLDSDSNGRMGGEILRERDRHSFEGYRERDAIVRRMMEIEKEIPPKKRFEIAIKTAKKWPDIQFALKFLGSDWMKYRFGKNNDIHPLHLIARYQPSYLINVLQRKEVRAAGESWLKQDSITGTPFWIPLLCSGLDPRRMFDKIIPELNLACPQLFLKTEDPPVVFLWEYVVRDGSAFPFALTEKKWQNLNNALSYPSSFEHLFQAKKLHPGFGAELEKQIIINAKQLKFFNHDCVFMGVESLPVEEFEWVPQLVNLQILELVSEVRYRHTRAGFNFEKSVEKIADLLEHPSADWQKVNRWIQTVIPVDTYTVKFDQWENHLKSDWEARQLRNDQAANKSTATPRKRI